MIEFDFVPSHLVAGEIAPHVNRHYHEMNIPDDYGPPEINWDYYIAAGFADQCRIVTARDNGKLIGYAVYSIGTSPRYKNILEANAEGTFIEKEYRGRVGPLLLKKADEFLQAHGVQRATHITNDESFGKILQRNGYKDAYKVWSIKYGE